MERELYTLKVGTIVIVSVMMLVGFYLALTRVDTFIRYQAIDACAKLGSQEQTTNGVRVSYPLSDVYETCLDRKGIK